MGMIMKNGVPYAQGSEIPEGGTKGQVLAKASNISGDFEWANGGGAGGGNANFDIGTVPLGGAGVYEVNAILNNGDNESVRAVYSRGANGELPEWFSMNVNSTLGSDNFQVATRELVNRKQDTLVSGTNIKTVNGNSLLVFNATDNIPATELNRAFAEGPIYLKYNGGYYPVVSVTEEGSNYYIGTTSGSGRGMTFYYDYYGTDLEFSKVETYELYGDLNVPAGSTTATIKRNLSQVQLVGSGDTVQYKVKGGNYAEQTFNLATTKYVQDNAGVNFEVGVEKWYGTYTADGVTYQVYSKLLDIGPLPSAAGVTNYPHGITGIKQILQINGFTNDGFVMNAPRQVASDNISIYQAQKSGNIAVEVGKDRSSKSGFVMLIYAKNN